MRVDGIDVDYEECAVALDGSAVWRNGVKYTQLDVGEMIEFLTWLERVFDGGVGFPNKPSLANGYISWRRGGGR